MNAIEIRGATKRYPKFTLGPIDLTVKRGEFFGIFGPPSAGKTSILRLILGLLEQDDGLVKLEGVNAQGVEVADRKLSMVFQNLALFPHMTGRENIVFPLVERGLAPAQVDKRLAAVAEVLHVGHILHKMPAQMSGGERQRIALGRALAGDSHAILLDEPIAALDARLREEMRVELKRLQRANQQTFVYVSHDEEEVMAVSDRIAVVIDGQIAQVGVPDEVYNQPNSLAVAKVVGSPPMNLFQGRVSDDGLAFECEHFASPIELPQPLRGGQVATLGVRPEHIYRSAGDAPEAQTVTVSTVEPLGSYTIVNVMLGGQLTMVRVDEPLARPADFGTQVSFDARRLHVFDRAGRRM